MIAIIPRGPPHLCLYIGMSCSHLPSYKHNHFLTLTHKDILLLLIVISHRSSLGSTTAMPQSHAWTKGKVVRLLRLSTEDYHESQIFLEKILLEAGLLGVNFKKTSSLLIIQALQKIKGRRGIPNAVCRNLDSFEGIKTLAGLSMKVNNDYCRNKKKIAERKLGRRPRQSVPTNPPPSSPSSSARPPSSQGSSSSQGLSSSQGSASSQGSFSSQGSTGSQYSSTKSPDEPSTAVIQHVPKPGSPILFSTFSTESEGSTTQPAGEIPNFFLQKPASAILFQEPPLSTNPEPASGVEQDWLSTDTLFYPIAIEDCSIYINNLVYPSQNISVKATSLQKDGSSGPITYQDLDFRLWKDIIRVECGFDEAHHSLHFSLLTIPMPHSFVVRDECSWQAAIWHMNSSGLTYCIFRMDFSTPVNYTVY